MRPAKSTHGSGRDQLEAEIEMDLQQLQWSRDEATIDAARSFYQSALGGRQVWPTGPRASPRTLWFLVGQSLVQVSRTLASDVLELSVDSPAAIAERCWDAGHTVRLRADDSDDFIVLDPFGREILLRRRTSVCPMGAGAAG